MDDSPPYDPRAIANLLIEVGNRFDLAVTHLTLQKSVFFLHEKFLKQTGLPLCKGYFEAWKHGPVHPQLWSAFRNAGRGTIRHHAYGIDLATGIERKIPEINNKAISAFVVRHGLDLLEIPAHRLVGLSHLPNGPWDKVTRRNGGQREYGARIPNELVVSSSSRPMMAISESPDNIEDLYEQPPS